MDELRALIKEAIHEAWNNNPSVGPADTFGNFLNRAAEAVSKIPELVEALERKAAWDCVQQYEANGIPCIGIDDD